MLFRSGVGEQGLARLAAQADGLNTYNHPRVEFFGWSWRDPSEENLRLVGESLESVYPLLRRSPAGTAAGVAWEVKAEELLRKSRLVIRGLLANYRGDVVGMTRAYRRALRLDPDDEGLKYALGISRTHEAVAREEIRHHPDDARAYGKLGYILWSAGRDEEAVDQFQKMTRLAPENPLGYLHLGVVYASRGDYVQSMAAYAQAAALSHTPEFTHTVEISVRLVRQMQLAVQRPTDPQVQFMLGYLLWEDGRPDRAIEPLKRAVTLDPTFREAHWYLGLSYAAEEQIAEAQAAFQRLLALDPQHSEARAQLARLRARGKAPRDGVR